MTENPAEPANSGRSRARRGVVSRSPHRDEYERLMVAGWSSLAIERYAAYRYGEDLPASTIRTYRSRQKIAAKAKPPVLEGFEPDSVQDVVAIRSMLIQLQQQRILIDVKHEQSMQKLFGSTKGEIGALSALLDAHKADLQDLGVFPKSGQTITVNGGATPEPTAENGAPRAQTLGDLFGVGSEAEMGLARVLHMAAKTGENGKTSGAEAG